MRYTQKFEDKYDLVGDSDDNVKEFVKNCGGILDKLGRLEDIEEELGIDLVTLSKASFAEALYFKSDKTNRIEYKPFTAMSIKYKTIIFGFDSTIVEFKDYGKTWALTKEELL